MSEEINVADNATTDAAATPENPAPAAADSSTPADPAPQDKASDATAAVAEPYTLDPVEGVDVSAEVLGKFTETAMANGIAKGAAQKLLNEAAPLIAKQQEQAMAATDQQWREAAKTDKEFGGEKFDENLAVAKTAISTFASPALQELLNTSPLGNHPEILRMFWKVGQTLKDDKIETGGSGAKGAAEKHPSEVLYPSMLKKDS